MHLPTPGYLPAALHLLWEKHRINSLLVEGGAHLYRSFLAAGLVDEVVHFIAPFHLGAGISLAQEALPDGARLYLHELSRCGDDIRAVWRRKDHSKRMSIP